MSDTTHGNARKAAESSEGAARRLAEVVEQVAERHAQLEQALAANRAETSLGFQTQAAVVEKLTQVVESKADVRLVLDKVTNRFLRRCL